VAEPHPRSRRRWWQSLLDLGAKIDVTGGTAALQGHIEMQASL
jgi:hypothetical protein